MRIHEYQARALLRQAGVPVPPDVVITSPDQAAHAFAQLQAPQVVVKAQVHAGGRGKAGYVKLVRSAEQARQACQRMFSQPMVSAQTGPAGVQVRKILLAQAVEIDHEYYLSVVIDRLRNCPVMMASAEGGVEIEQVARHKPQAIHKAWLHPHLGLQAFQARQLAIALGMTGQALKQTVAIMQSLARLFVQKDCSLAEINPLVRSPDGQIWAIDAKFNFDDNALFRQPELQAMLDPAEQDPNELHARK
ncbi:MAG: succinate--CoA ligase subunit beta, partial [Phycisphaerae bacterium]